MKRLRNLIAVMAVTSMAAVLTGCGDDDDDGDDNQNPGPNIVAPGDVAALTAQNKVYTVNVAGQADPITLRFPAAGQYEMTQAGVTETGAISGAARADNRWTLNVTPAAGQAGAQEGVLQLDFTAANAGTWTFTPAGAQAETGTFTISEGTGGTTDGTTNGGDNGGTTDGGGGGSDLTGQTLQINYTGGGGDKFDFTSSTATSWENGTQTGTYTYDETGGRVDVVLGDGQMFEITLGAGNAVTVVYRANAGAEAQSFAGTYTL